jgi:hypothetical protein
VAVAIDNPFENSEVIIILNVEERPFALAEVKPAVGAAETQKPVK